jgi:protein gp37
VSGKTAIEWTESSWNPVRGTKGRHTCVRISHGCKNCYAASMNRRGLGGEPLDYVAGADIPRLDTDALVLPLRWRKPRKVFVCSMTDLFWDAIPDEDIDRVFAVMALARKHTFQALTKRADRMRAYLNGEGVAQRISDAAQVLARASKAQFSVPRDIKAYPVGPDGEFGYRWFIPWPLPNLWLGVSVEDQQRADERIPVLLQTSAAVRWVSYEPALGPVSFRWMGAWPENAPTTAMNPAGATGHLDGMRRLDWIVVGGESGPHARAFDIAWARQVVEDGKAAGVPVFVKQLGAKPIAYDPQHQWLAAGGDFRTGGLTYLKPRPKDRKGGDMSEWPEDVRVRQMPQVSA